MTKEAFSKLAASIPQEPGCYRYYDETHTLIYVGKAKNLRKRVSSYFNKTLDNLKTHRLVFLIHHIEFTVTGNEHDAFLLENSLIKHHQPKFNISLKDDKTYPYIVIKKEHFPRVFITRKFIRDGSEYLGPFTGVFVVRELLERIKQSIPLRSCNLNLSPQNIAKGKFKVCLEYHLGNCKGPCEGLQSEDQYRQNLQQVRHILKGNTGEVIGFLKEEMLALASEMKFEKAEQVKKKIESLQQYESKSTVVNPRLNNLDVISILNDEPYAYVNYMKVTNGSVLHSKTLRIEKKLAEENADILALALHKFREDFGSTALEVVAPIPVVAADANIKITIPRAGDKKKLLELSRKNAMVYRDEIRRKNSLMLEAETEEKDRTVLKRLQEALQLPDLPIHIECFDNSNFQGAFPVGAMVCFKNGRPFKKEYRQFHIKTVEGINDFASMAEIVHRRYKKLSEEDSPLPQLVIIDGGKGQLSAALESIDLLGLSGKMTVIGLAKREEQIFFRGDSQPLQLSFTDPAHLLLRRIRDEVHRFGITFHRNVRSKKTITNELQNIPGIGDKTATELLTNFRSVNKIKTLTERELAKAIGMSKARIVYQYFQSQKD